MCVETKEARPSDRLKAPGYANDAGIAGAQERSQPEKLSARVIPMPQLSCAEKRVAALLLEGCSNSEISQESGIKLRTVKAAMDRMFRKYGIAGGIKRVKLAVILYREEKEGTS